MTHVDPEPSVQPDMFRCMWCKTVISGGDGRRVRRTIPLGSPCPSCGKRPIVLEPIPVEERKGVTHADAGKIELLKAICENPGWQPVQPVSGAIEMLLQGLAEEGWIVPRLDGWEATPEALQGYPAFEPDDDAIATRESAADPFPVLEYGRPRDLEWLAVFCRGLLEDMPLSHLLARCQATAASYSDDRLAWDVAYMLAERLSSGS